MVFHIARGGNKYNRSRMSFERWNIIEASIRLGSGTTFYFLVTNEDYKEMMTSTNLKVLLVLKENLSSFKIYFKKDYFWKPLLSLFWNCIILTYFTSLKNHSKQNLIGPDRPTKIWKPAMIYSTNRRIYFSNCIILNTR